MYIYKITNKINGKVYIGQTTRTVKERWDDHLYERKRRSTKFYKALNFYGPDNFFVEEIFFAFDRQSLDFAEKELITSFKALDREYGYNTKEGGNDGIVSEESRKKLSKIMKKRWEDPVFRKNRTDKQKEIYKRLKISDIELMKKIKRKKMKKPFNVFFSIEDSQTIRPFRNFLKGDFLGFFNNIIEFVESYPQCDVGNVSKCLNKKKKQHKGYIFEYTKFNDDDDSFDYDLILNNNYFL